MCRVLSAILIADKDIVGAAANSSLTELIIANVAGAVF